MKSDLAKALKGVPLPDQDDAFLVSHLLGGKAEIDELDGLLADLTKRRDEAVALRGSIEQALVHRHPDGRNFTALGFLVRVPATPELERDNFARFIAIEPVETLAIE